MLVESRNIRQITGEPRRRWFSSSYFDLIVWLGQDGNILTFQLCYDVPGSQRVLAWSREASYSHHRIDDGEGRPGRHKATPILIADGEFEHERVAARFKRDSRTISARIAEFVYAKLKEYAAAGGSASGGEAKSTP